MDAIADKLAIMEQLARFCTLVDAFAIERFDAVFADDIVWDFGDGKIVTGLERLKQVVSGTLIGNPHQGRMMHSVSNIVVTVSGDRAESMANCNAAHQGAGAYAGQIYFAWLTYNDHWLRMDDQWRIAQRIYRTQFCHGPRKIAYGG